MATSGAQSTDKRMTGHLAGKMPLWHMASSSCHVFRPVRRLARQGLHFGLFVKQFENSTPSRATRSKAGVLIQPQP